MGHHLGNWQNELSAESLPTLDGIPDHVAVDLHRTMLRIRRSQEALIEEYHPADEMRCPVHFCVGQESLPAGIGAHLLADDYMFSHHRSHGYYLAKGGPMGGFFAELYGKATGSNRGKAGSQELSEEGVNFFSGTILVGAMAIAAGAALAQQMRGTDQVSIAVFGDGGADEGLVYETLAFSALKKLPIVFVCENNLYSIHTRQSARQVPCDLSGRAEAFGVPATRLYGNDVSEVYRVAGGAVDRARKGEGPSLLEVDTYRWCGHVGPEDDDHLEYRPLEELETWKMRCPIQKLREALLTADLIDPARIEAEEKSVSDEIAEAFRFAKESSFPEPEALTRDVFSDSGIASDTHIQELEELPIDFTQPEAVPKPY